jgi:alpha-tubulin suppressor-like RCC1 family protein
MRASVLALGILAAFTGCGVDRHAFECETDAQCGTGGRCEAEGYCSAVDASCVESGYRFVDSSPGDLANTCTRVCAADVVAGGSTTCVRLADNTVQCFGANSTGQLGLGGADDAEHALPGPAGGIFAGRPFSRISVGGGHACGLTGGNDVACWGANDRGQTGATPSAFELEPWTVTNAEAVAAGARHTCSLAAGVVSCWGDNTLGQLGADDIGVVHTSPATVVRYMAALTGVLSIASSAASDFTCASQSSLGCWGDDSGGQLGDGTNTPRDFYEPFGNLSGGGLPLATGNGHGCAAQPDSTVACWGSNDRGQLGNPSTAPHQTATRTTTPLDVTALTAGDRFTCAITRAAGEVVCFGDNTEGQLGDGSNDGGFVTVAGTAGTTSLAAGSTHVCAIVDKRVLCWGGNFRGQLGDGTQRSRSMPRAARLACPAP